jgi:hypothetical protein
MPASRSRGRARPVPGSWRSLCAPSDRRHMSRARWTPASRCAGRCRSPGSSPSGRRRSASANSSESRLHWQCGRYWAVVGADVPIADVVAHDDQDVKWRFLCTCSIREQNDHEGAPGKNEGATKPAKRNESVHSRLPCLRARPETNKFRAAAVFDRTRGRCAWLRCRRGSDGYKAWGGPWSVSILT